MISWSDLQGIEKLENVKSNATNQRICVRHFESFGFGVSDNITKGGSHWERHVMHVYVALSWWEKSS